MGGGERNGASRKPDKGKKVCLKCICIMSSERCVPGHVSRTGLSPCFQCPYGTYQPDEGEKVCLMYLYYVVRALCPRPRLENRVVALVSVSLWDLPARRGGESVFNVSVSCLQSVVPQATSLEQGCRLAFNVPMGPTSQTSGRKCV